MRPFKTLTGIVVLAAFVIAIQAGPAHATFPGANGKILSATSIAGGGCQQLIDPATGSPSEPGACPAGEHVSPDGARVVGPVISAVNPFVVDTRIQDLDGSDRIDFPGLEELGAYTSWSPDGRFVAIFDHQYPSECCDESVLSYARSDGVGGRQVLGTGLEADVPWSRFGRIALWSGRNEFPYFRTFTPDGCCGTFVEQQILQSGSIDWDPTADRFIYAAVNTVIESPPDLSDQQVLASGPEVGGAVPRYSPDGTKILYGTGDIRSMDQDGTGKTNLTDNPAVDKNPVWSPDSRKIAFRSNRDGDFDIYVMDRDGSNVVQLTDEPREEPLFDWQPILRDYPHAKGAGPIHASLVPAYHPCASPNRVHAAPLAFGSCNPPARASTQLTLGTFDANGKPVNSVAWIRIGVVPGNPGTPADEAEAHLQTSITDVRLASDLSDYAGSLEVRVPLQITDRSNTPYPGGPGPGTVQAFTFSWSVPCAATADPAIGAQCILNTTADALMPGSALEGRRAIWETQRIEVRDGAGQPFLRQGVFVP